ncbi:hypothetical protein [Actibacterium sp. MT2.3-13A]|uniref:hypothetical protein n=1 Tax=Actibacterium sp. MT2.3-13A TaxID=2828332 RepID=UPI001BADAB90|nr:hypothetical protein [Actibacterium sp. MT2.3-13A]
MKLEDFAPFSEAEQTLIDECADPERITFGDGELPAGDDSAPCLRAGLVRLILLGGAGAPVLHDKGLRLRGARLTGVLDLQGCDCPHDITFSECRLDEALNLVNARLKGLHFSGSALAGLAADNASFTGSLFLRDGSVSRGEISLAGARLGGDLQLCGAEIHSDGQDALFAPALNVEGSVFLGNYPYTDGDTALVTQGMLFLSSIHVGHDLFVSNTAITPTETALGSPMFGATEAHGHDVALSLERARVGGLLYLRANRITRGIVSLAGAEVAQLTDEPSGPGAAHPIRLDGFRYHDFSRSADTAVQARLDWLARRPVDTPFTSQPYVHLADVLTRIGHREDARTVLMHKERLLHAENRRLLMAERGQGLGWAAAWASDALLRVTIGYGYRPVRALVMAAAMIAALGWFYDQCWRAGDMAPNSGPIQTSAPWIDATRSHPENPGAFWSRPGQAGQDWETFHPYAYAADLFIPLLQLGQQAGWAPSTTRSPWGRVGWWLRWVAEAVGWVVTALGAAAITGVIRRD